MDSNLFQTSDLGRIFSFGRKISQRKKKGQPVQELENKLAALKKSSTDKTKMLIETTPVVTIANELPIYEKEKTITQLLNDNQVIIVAGETGCGKTTQLPKICLKAGFGCRGLIAHTQPRRVAATSVANRIAQEMSVAIGSLVGYSVRFSDKTSSKTRIKLMTDGVLLSEIQSDPMLSRYEVIIIDEAHERSLNIDFLLGFLNKLIKKRKELKVIITSATIDPESFSRYFFDAPIVQVEGRTFPVQVNYLPVSDDDIESSEDANLLNVKNAVESCFEIGTGDLLIFAHGEQEIKTIAKYLKQQEYQRTVILPLFARLSINEQQAIFKSSNQRKIVVATNVAETSLTIPNILFVIDIGTARVSRYSQRSKIQQLPIEKISQASAEQRKGRCGRIAPGVCFRLYSEEDFDSRPEFTEPEIKRTNLSSVVLRLKAMGVDEPDKFPFIDSPEQRQWKVAFNLLYELAAMDENRRITAIGKKMSNLPLDPQLARILLEPTNKAINEMLIVASFLSVRDIRLRPQDKQQKADQLHAKYIDKTSDIITLINLWNFLQKQRKESSSSQFRRWCQNNMINFVGWLEWRNVYFQIKEELKSLGIIANTAPSEPDEVHQALVCGFVSHIMMKTQEKYYQGARGLKVWVHPSSVFFKQNSPWILSTEMIETEKVYARSNSPIKVEWLEKITPHLSKKLYQDIHWRKRKGYAACFLNISLFGLPIVNRRLIDYSRIDVEESRKLFLLEGLVGDKLNQNFPFLSANRSSLKTIREEEEKLRVSHRVISDSDLANKYDDVVPRGIVTSIQLKKWLDKNWKERNKQLTFSKQSLYQDSKESVEDFPSEIVVRGFPLPISYSFSPGKLEDGITVDIPKKMLHQFKQSDFDWLIPGYLTEKILASLKSLPKIQRKKLIPLPTTAKQCFEKIIVIDNYQELSFRKLLVDILKQVKGVVVTPDEFDLKGLPNHLRVKFKDRSQSENGTRVISDINDLKPSDKKRSAIAENSPSIGNDKLFSWPTSGIKLEHIEKNGNRSLRLFYGLKDQTMHVEVRSFSDLNSAQFFHRLGVARLVILDQLVLIKEIKNSWPDRREIEMLQIRFGGFEELLDWVAISIILSIADKVSPRIETEVQFNQVRKEFSSKGRAKVADRLNSLLKLLKQMQGIYSKLSNLNNDVYKASVDDIKQQLNELWSKNKFIQQGEDICANYTRYFKAIESRITRIEENFPKEAQSLENWQEWSDWYYEIEGEDLHFATQSSLEQLFWMMQEFRISLFAPNVKVKGSVSSHKLQKLFDTIESKMDEL